VPLGPVASVAIGQAGFGTIKGRLVWGGAEAPAPRNLVEKGQATKDPAVCATAVSIPDQSLLVDPKTKGIRNGFAYVVAPKGENPEAVKALVAKSASVVIDQKNCEFLPFATAVHQDQKVVFKSSDPVNHNVNVQPFSNAPFNAILPPNGEMDKTFTAERQMIPMKCDLHPWMKGYLMVFDHPFFAVTAADGSFELKGVPAGMQNVVVRLSSGFVTPGLARGMPVTVSAGQVTDVGDIKLDPAKAQQ
jgi:plastocyanin